MKNLTVLNFREKCHHSLDSLLLLVKAQIENSLELGWKSEDIIILSNIDFEYMGIKPIIIPLNDFCFTGSKMFGVKYLFENGCKDVVWSHDLDAWQNVEFNCPEFKDVGYAQYSRPKVNGGSLFWKPESIDIIDRIVAHLLKKKERKEEPTLNYILRKYPNRVSTLNYTYNVGCSGFIKRYNKSIKPIHVCHFHPTNKLAWETHALNRTGCGISISYRLEKLIRQYYPKLATALSNKNQNTVTKEMKNED